MRYKLLFLAGAMTVGILAGAVHHNAHAMNNSEGAFIVAQNSEKPGLFDRIFNRSNNNSNAKPLFLNDKASSSGVKPYDFSGRNRQGRSSAGSVSWDAFVREREEHARQIAAVAQAAAERLDRESERFIQMQMAEMEAGSSGSKNAGQKAGTQKKMVYDPQKVWTYDPNARRNPSDEAPRIYNTR